MLEHVVLFRLAPQAPAAHAESMIQALVGLKDRIPEIVSISGGANLSDRSSGYSHGLVVRFADADHLATYMTHPAHVAVVEHHVKPIIDSVLVLDIDSADLE